MKKYFAKYLPVEGDIEEGDKFIWTGNNLGTIFEAGSAEENTVEDFGHDRIFNKLVIKKVNLFLCSRDIQVGNEIIHNNDLSTKLEYTPHLYSMRRSNDFDMDNYFKVIGEISSEVDWLNDNQEIPDSYINLWKETAEISIEDIERIGGKIGEPIIYGDGKVRIKCPCCKTYK